MNIYESGEDYLEQILMLLEQKGHARSIDIAVGLNVSKPSVSVAMKKLKENGYIKMSTDNLISLTDKGYAIARKIYDRHQALTKYLIQIGVPAGVGVLQYLLTALASEYELKLVLGLPTWLVSILLTFCVSLIVGLMVARKNRHIDMVAALKTAE